jgi:hypothetical protein
LSFTTALVAVNGDSVALTHPPGAKAAGSGLTHPCVVKSRCFELAVTLKYVVFFGLTLPTLVKLPSAFVVAAATFRSRDETVPRRIVAPMSGTGMPPSVSLPFRV